MGLLTWLTRTLTGARNTSSRPVRSGRLQLSHDERNEFQVQAAIDVPLPSNALPLDKVILEAVHAALA